MWVYCLLNCYVSAISLDEGASLIMMMKMAGIRRNE